MLQSKMQTYNTESLTIYIGLGSIVEQNVNIRELNTAKGVYAHKFELK